MAKALFGLLVIAGLGFTGAATYKWYTGNCPFGLCHGDDSTATATVKKGCCGTATISPCCSESGNPEACTGECPTTKEAKGESSCCTEGKCCKDKDSTAKKDGSCCSEGGCSKDKENNKTEKKDADTPK